RWRTIMTIKAILFDLDNTLIWDDRSTDEAFCATCEQAALRYPEIDPGELEAAVRQKALSLYESFEIFPFAKMIEVTHLEALWARFDEGEHPNFRKLQAFAPIFRRESWTCGLRAIGINDVQLGEELGEMFPVQRRARPLL